MEVNSVNASVPAGRQTLAIENTEPKRTEATETASQENREAYRVEISQEAQQASAAQESEVVGPENVEAVKAYTNTGRIAG